MYLAANAKKLIYGALMRCKQSRSLAHLLTNYLSYMLLWMQDGGAAGRGCRAQGLVQKIAQAGINS
jgi:hypothetical protein